MLLLNTHLYTDNADNIACFSSWIIQLTKECCTVSIEVLLPRQKHANVMKIRCVQVDQMKEDDITEGRLSGWLDEMSFQPTMEKQGVTTPVWLEEEGHYAERKTAEYQVLTRIWYGKREISKWSKSVHELMSSSDREQKYLHILKIFINSLLPFVRLRQSIYCSPAVMVLQYVSHDLYNLVTAGSCNSTDRAYPLYSVPGSAPTSLWQMVLASNNEATVSLYDVVRYGENMCPTVYRLNQFVLVLTV